MKFLAATDQDRIEIDCASSAHINLEENLLTRECKHLPFHDRMRKDEIDEMEYLRVGCDLQVVGSRSSHNVDRSAAVKLVAHVIEHAPIALGELKSYAGT